MNDFEALKNNLIPNNVLVKLLSTYSLIGKNEQINDSLKEEDDYLIEQNIISETYTITRHLGIKVTDNRLRLLLNKNSQPLNQEERKVIGIKEVLSVIIKEAESIPFNGSDFLQYLNRIFGKNTHRFTNRIYNELLGRNYDLKKTSIRAILENMIDEYHMHITRKNYEPIYLSLVVYLYLDLMRPYTDHNELAGELMLYYMLIRVGVVSIKYSNFFELLYNDLNTWNNEMQLCYVNFPKSPLQLNDFIPLTLTIIDKSYQTIIAKIKASKQEKRMFKRDGIEQTIFKMPNTFSKEDIRQYHPQVSESTLNRSLFKLRDEGIIMPLGKGRSARWVKLISDDDPRNIFGGNYEASDKE